MTPEPEPEPDPIAAQPLGPRVDGRPAQSPQAVTLAGRHGTVERLDPVRHRASLWEAVRDDDRIWTYMAYGPFADEAVFSDWLATREEIGDPFYYAIVEPAGLAVGLAALMSIRPDMKVIEVGNILLSPAVQRTPLATEAQYLLARHAFETLGFRRYEWKCNALNAASRRAALRFGFTFEGIFRNHMIIKGRNRDTAWFAMLDSEWPARKAAFERWLDLENFNPDGSQKTRLGDLNAGDP
jgi:RimJ/RimL family protein N-acetyltransferase